MDPHQPAAVPEAGDRTAQRRLSAERITLGEVFSWMEGGEESEAGPGPLGEEWKRLCREAEGARQGVLAKESLRDLMEKVQARMAGRGRGSEYQI